LRIALQQVYYASQSQQKVRQQGRTPGGCEEKHQVSKEERRAAARKNTEPRQPDSRYDKSFARLPTGTPSYRQMALFKGSTSSLLLAKANPLRKKFLSVHIGHTSFPDRL
jgi:hypothetical protein